MERNTRQRQAVLGAIERAGRALSPAEILALAQPTVATLNLSTIYRHLSGLQQTAQVVKVQLAGQAARFEAACEVRSDAGGHHHHHFHCSRCDGVYALHGCPGPMQDLAPAGFRVEAHELTLRGVCAACAVGADPGAAP